MSQNQKPLFDNLMHKLPWGSKRLKQDTLTPVEGRQGTIEQGSTPVMEQKRFVRKRISLEDLLLQLVLAQATDLARAGRYKEAERLLVENIHNLEIMPAALDLQARMYAQQKRFEEAHLFWMRALQLDPTNDAYMAGLLRLREYWPSKGRESNHAAGGGHDYLVYRLVLFLGSYIEVRKLGVITLAQAGYEVSLPGAPDTVWIPDLAFVQASHVPAVNSLEWNRPWKLAPDLVVEVASPEQSQHEGDQRAYGWLQRGVRLVWIIWPTSKTVDVWVPGSVRPVKTLEVDGTLEGLEVVPGFTCPLVRIFGSTLTSTP